MQTKSNSTIVNTVDESGKKLKLKLKALGHKVLQDAQMVYNVQLTALIKKSSTEGSELLSRQQLEQYLDNIGIWTEDDGRQFVKLQLDLRALELRLKSGGIKVSEARKIALDMKTKRAIMLVLYNRRSQFDGITMESISENKKFQFILTKCLVTFDDNMPFFLNTNDYEARQSEQAALDSATALANRMYGYDDATEGDLVENKWLKQFEFADDKGRLIDDTGRLVDVNGHLINEDGRLVDDNGDFVDNQGQQVDENGEFVVVTKPFLDDVTGNPIGIKTVKANKRKKVKRKT